MTRNKSSHNDGLSLVEMLVALGIMGILAVGVARFSSNFEKSKARSTAKTHTKNINKRLLKFVERDMKFQTAFSVQDNGLTLEITRRKTFDQADTDATYVVRYVTRCQQIPNDIRSILRDRVYAVSRLKQAIYSSAHTCFDRLKDICNDSTYPQVFIEFDDTDDRIPVYRPNLFPDFATQTAKRELRKGTAGTAMCSGESGGKIQVMVNSAYLLSAGDSSESVSVLSDQILLTTDNIAGVTLLPNE
ncbi:PulJ/GspJ family protein [Pseudobacteriovorax antillogorgiicola]|uniref:Prepilin-type N-terminal cleavage/methylation domain-containing protein n=1 Tax=Pseudobacteriovorax antillogorgiicola TaxID=1513793 RepID=A0A1Y6BNC6_9BACT|nr:prepilin-type N-terminal cleavage/methylation domain-containing protein [Pseudobacteriovorax antillogorgiicola]TCS55414.1 prepilin-type N-terminal cleavage/methylation domain-containing protein [Pseudobacteriovorax antillogorgiicola]SMF12664.1 prepilin-type N-terminal cleavage/methylation domain-containing protein [Pseudobacteriovorax antillogorgiicola]